MTAVCAMSGGVDSSVAAALALESGLACTGYTLKLYNGNAAAADDALKVASSLGISHFTLDFSREFKEFVVRHFVETYENGATPNPCIECNRNIKFNLPLLRSQKLVFDHLVTGHYARIKHDSASGRHLLLKALDEKKDQSYVLYSLSQQQLKTAFFPLGGLSKNDVRKIAEERKFVNAGRQESQDICFVPDGDYAGFIERYTGKTYPQGDIVDLEGNIIGRHKGLIRYTIGQRRGLGVAANVPVYVAGKSMTANTVTLAPDGALYSKSLTVNNINFIACNDFKKPMRVMVKTRYLQKEQSAVAEQTGEDNIHIEFEKPQRAVTRGQAAVMYDGDIVVGGGTIC